MFHLGIFLIAAISLSPGVLSQSLIVRPRNITTLWDKPAVLRCEPNTTADSVVEWLYNGTKIYDSTSKTVNDPAQYEVTYEDGSYNLTILKVQSGNTGKYSCRMPEEDVEVDVFVVGVGDINCNDNEVVNEGYPVNLDCSARFTSDGAGTLAPVMEWYVGDAETVDSYFDYKDRWSIEPITRHSLRTDAKPMFNGHTFTCRLTYLPRRYDRPAPPETYPDLSCNVSVTVYYGPRDLLIEPKVYGDILRVDVGEIVNCTAEANPEPVIRWRDINGDELTNSPSLRVTEDMRGTQNVWCHVQNKVDGREVEVTKLIVLIAGADHIVLSTSALILSWIMLCAVY